MAMLLSLAGIYAVMSFTVTRRTRETGIRVALGGVLTALFGDSVRPAALLGALGYSTLMLGVCLLACIVPTPRALQVEPTQALRADS